MQIATLKMTKASANDKNKEITDDTNAKEEDKDHVVKIKVEVEIPSKSSPLFGLAFHCSAIVVLHLIRYASFHSCRAKLSPKVGIRGVQ